MKMISISQVLFGSDYPIRPVSEAVAGVASYAFSPAERRAIERDNALQLLPRLQEYSQEI